MSGPFWSIVRKRCWSTHWPYRSYGVREVGSSNPDRRIIGGWVFSPNRQLVRFSHPNYDYLSTFWIYLECYPREEAINSRPLALSLYEVANHRPYRIHPYRKQLLDHTGHIMLFQFWEYASPFSVRRLRNRCAMINELSVTVQNLTSQSTIAM